MKPSAYGPFEYTPIIHRPRIVWPNGAQLAVWVVPNIEFFALDEKIPPGSGGSNSPAPDVPSWSARDYGNRVGVFRLMKVLDKYGVRGTVALNSDLCVQHPQIIEEGMKRNWEWKGHNQSNTRRLNEIPPETEREVIAATLSTIEKATGARPRGWLGSGLQETWNTLDHLVEEGVDYVSDWTNDDQPYVMSLENGRSIVAMPYSHEINDKPAFEKYHRTADQFGEMIRRQFDVLYREGAENALVMGIALHPYLIGAPHRIDALDAALAHLARHPKVWFATGSEIATAYKRQIGR